MTIIDCNASAGNWPTRQPSATSVADVWHALSECGVDRCLMASLDSAWCANPHAPNQNLIDSAAELPGVSPVPTIDPSVHTWRDELATLGRAGDVRMIRLLPTYGCYALEEADELLDEARQAGLTVQFQTRLEDPRRHHPRAMVPDLPIADILCAARRHLSVTVVIGGARFGELLQHRDEILDHKLIYADTSQCDGMDALAVLCAAGLSDRLLYGSHAPLFEVPAGLRRVVDDLDPATAKKVLGGNAKRVLWPE